MYINTDFYNFLRIKIEPYWNVNSSSALRSASGNNIKIEPYWNVNPTSRYLPNTVPYKDRTILECKYRSGWNSSGKSSIKIEPYWNVNEFKEEFKENKVK